MKILFILIPVVAAIGALVMGFRNRGRIGAVLLIFGAVIFGAGGLIAPHRLAEELARPKPASEEWQRGALETRDVVYRTLPVLVSAFISLAALALIPPKKE